MSFNFPASPTVGQVYQNYTWDGEKWTMGATPVGAVRYDVPQSLTEPQKAQARSNVYAAPLDALAYSGMQINGSMEVSQERGFSNPVNSGYAFDGWRMDKVGSMVVTLGTYPAASLVAGLSNWLVCTVSTAQASLSAGDYVSVSQPIEGYRTTKLGFGFGTAQSLVIAFWSAHHRPGPYSGTIRNASATRSYAFTYTQNVADAPEYKVVTIPGCADGTWAADNTIGISLSFSVGVGTTYATAAGSWAVGNFLAATGQINGVASTADVFRLTGVVVLPGVEAPSAARSPLIMRPYGQEVEVCKRYFHRRPVMWRLQAEAGGLYGFTSPNPVSMRASPTCTLDGTSRGNISSVSFSTTDTEAVNMFITAGGASGDTFIFGEKLTADARL